MKEKILDIFSVIAVIGGVFAIIFLIMLGSIQLDTNQDNARWNNGYHQCGGKWVYEQAVGHRYSTNYIYKCDKCGMREEFIEYRNN